jgi:hypothetical protein
MSTRATANFEMTSWDEKPYDEIDGQPRLARASVANTYRGDIEGQGKVEYLMLYRDDSSASFVGLERISGRLGGRSGSFVLQHSGTYEGGTTTATSSVVPGSGSGDLHNLRGQGSFVSQYGQLAPVTLDYEFGDGA